VIVDVQVGDFCHEKVKSVSWMRNGIVLEVHRDPEGDGVVKLLLSGGRTEGWSYRSFLAVYDVYR
jgi:hypothetical protein